MAFEIERNQYRERSQKWIVKRPYFFIFITKEIGLSRVKGSSALMPRIG